MRKAAVCVRIPYIIHSYYINYLTTYNNFHISISTKNVQIPIKTIIFEHIVLSIIG